MKKSHLLDFIRIVLKEQSKQFDTAKSNKYALLNSQKGLYRSVIVYNQTMLKKFVMFLFKMQQKISFHDHADLDFEFEQFIKNEQNASDVVIAVVSTKKQNEYDKKYYGNCYDAETINYTASVENSKMGIVAYEAALYYATEESGGLYPDRTGVKPSAQNIWKKYETRGDVHKRKFDNMNDPKTPPKHDDCYLHGEDFLDNVYVLETKPASLSVLEINHLSFISTIVNELNAEIDSLVSSHSYENINDFNVTEQMLENIIKALGRYLFQKRY